MPVTDLKISGERLREAIRAKRTTAVAVARKMEVSNAAMSLWLRRTPGGNGISADYFELLWKALDVKPEELLEARVGVPHSPILDQLRRMVADNPRVRLADALKTLVVGNQMDARNLKSAAASKIDTGREVEEKRKRKGK